MRQASGERNSAPIDALPKPRDLFSSDPADLAEKLKAMLEALDEPTRRQLLASLDAPMRLALQELLRGT